RFALVVFSFAGCAPALSDVKPALSETDSGNLWFATGRSVVRRWGQSRLVLGAPVVISGELRFPPGAGPFPAVILAHGCGGIRTPELGWGPLLREWGYATFVVDSFRGRGLTEVCTNARTLTGIQRITDASGEPSILATLPTIDTRPVPQPRRNPQGLCP